MIYSFYCKNNRSTYRNLTTLNVNEMQNGYKNNNISFESMRSSERV